MIGELYFIRRHFLIQPRQTGILCHPDLRLIILIALVGLRPALILMFLYQGSGLSHTGENTGNRVNTAGIQLIFGVFSIETSGDHFGFRQVFSVFIRHFPSFGGEILHTNTAILEIYRL